MPLFTNETHATRALAAEIRHDPTAARRFFESLLGVGLEPLTEVDVQERAHAHVDVRAKFGETNVGIEGKIAHILSAVQQEAELATVDFLVFVVDDRKDAPEELPDRVFAVTWAEILAAFADTRLRLSDISRMAQGKNLRTRRKFEAAVGSTTREPRLAVLDETQTITGFPSILIDSFERPSLGGAKLRAQIQSVGGGFYQATVGIQTDLPNVDGQPAWVEAIRECGPELEVLVNQGPFAIEPASSSHENRLALARTNGLPPRHVKGYTDYVGIKTKKTQEYRGLTEETIRWVIELSLAKGATPE